MRSAARATLLEDSQGRKAAERSRGACGQDWKFKDGTVRGAVYTCGAHEIGVRRAIVVAIDLTYPESSKQDFDGALEDSMKRYGLPTQNRSGYDALFGSAWEAVWRAKRVEYQIYFSMGGVTDARALSYTLRILDGMHCPAEPRAGGFRTCSESMHACEKWGGPCLPADRVWCMTRMGFRWRGEICFATAAECQRNYNLVSSEHHPTTCNEQSGHVATPR